MVAIVAEVVHTAPVSRRNYFAISSSVLGLIEVDWELREACFVSA